MGKAKMKKQNHQKLMLIILALLLQNKYLWQTVLSTTAIKMLSKKSLIRRYWKYPRLKKLEKSMAKLYPLITALIRAARKKMRKKKSWKFRTVKKVKKTLVNKNPS